MSRALPCKQGFLVATSARNFLLNLSNKSHRTQSYLMELELVAPSVKTTEFSTGYYYVTLKGYAFEGFEKEYNAHKKEEWNRKFAPFIIAAIGVVSTLLGAVLGALLAKSPEIPQKDIQLNPIVIPKIQIVHDTVYISKKVNSGTTKK